MYIIILLIKSEIVKNVDSIIPRQTIFVKMIFVNVVHLSGLLIITIINY